MRLSPRRVPRSMIVGGTLTLAVVVLILVWSWDWFIPLAEAQASAAIGRRVTIGHIHAHLGRLTRLVADDVTIANPDGWPTDQKFATADHLAIEADIAGYLHDRTKVAIPRVEVDHPVIDVANGPDNKPNYVFTSATPSVPNASPSPSIGIGDLVITDGHAHVVLPQYKTDTKLDIATEAGPPGGKSTIVLKVDGTYAGQPVKGSATGGALLSLRDPDDPYPIDVTLANGATSVKIKGTVQDPLHFKGTDVTVDLAGPDMSRLYPLTGVPIPQTPPYRITGKLDYADHKIRLSNMAGKVGRSDLEGTIAVDPGPERQQVTANLRSKLVNLDDLAGFIGSTPGTKNGTATAQEKAEAAREASSNKLLPDQPINLPRLKAADVTLHYKGDRIEGRSIPLDNLVANLGISDGRVTFKPLSFAVGKGQIASDIDLMPAGDNAVRARFDVNFQRVDVARIMAATHAFGGSGTIGGRAVLDGTGASIAQLVGRGNGDLKLFATGGNLSAFLVNLSGLEFGQALVSALGLPTRTNLRCMVVDLPLNHGVLTTNTMLIDTDENNVVGSGTVDLNREAMDYKLKTTSKHLSVGTIPAPILIRGALRSPSILPDPASLAVRGGAMAVLGVLIPGVGALIPTIQLGLGEDNDCGRLIAETGRSGSNKLTTKQIRARSADR